MKLTTCLIELYYFFVSFVSFVSLFLLQDVDRT